MAPPNKSKMAAAAILNYRKNVNNYALDKDICTKFYRDDHVTKSRNRKLIRVTSSNERLKHKCVVLSDQCRYFNPIWYRAQTILSTHPNGQIHII